MGLDIYAGTLTRYYSHNWKNIVHQLFHHLSMPSLDSTPLV